METASVLYLLHTLTDLDETSAVCSLQEADHMDVTIVSQSYSATNWQQEVCHFLNAFDKSGGVSFIYSNKTRYVYCTLRAGQLSNLP
jgi:hypothetical protein